MKRWRCVENEFNYISDDGGGELRGWKMYLCAFVWVKGEAIIGCTPFIFLAITIVTLIEAIWH